MMSEPADSIALDPDDPPGAAELSERLCDDQVRRWLDGHRIPAEAYLQQNPALREDDEAAFGLIYGEFMLRESLGEAPQSEEFLVRFPQYAARFRRQLEVHAALRPEEDGGDVQAATLPATGASSPAPAAARLPAVRGFEILAVLGRGGTGVVYKALQVGLKRLVALKVIRFGPCAPELPTRFRAEAEAVARFQHPNIVQVFEVGEQEGLGYLALEYAAGGSLQENLAGTPRTPHEAARLLEALARAVEYAHRRGIVHRDLKPANVVLTAEGVPKITDFGLAKLMEEDQGHTHTGDILGTPSYMSPEQARGTPAAGTPTADIYALGAILYEVLTGRPPFKGATPLSTLEQVSSQDPLPPGRFQRGIPRDLETICLKCLEKEPRRRYARAEDLADDLRRFLDGRPIVARPAPFWEWAWKLARRRPTTAAALASSAVAVVALYGGALYYNARLRGAVTAAETAEHAALDQRNLALKALNQLVYGVQEKLGETPATRSLRRGLLDTAIVGLDEIARSAEASAPNLSRAVAHQKLGEIFLEVGRSDDARRQLEQSRQLAEGLARARPRDLAIKDCLSKAHAGLAELDRSGGRYADSKAHCRRVVELTEQVTASDPGGTESRRRRIGAYFQLGRVHGFALELGQAEVWIRKALELAERWAADEPGNNQAKDMLSSCLRKLADMRKFAGDAESARGAYLRAIAIGRQTLEAEPANVEFRSHLAMALDDLAGVLHGLHQLAEARPLYAEAERHFSGLVASDPEDMHSRLRLVYAQYDLAKLERDESRFGEAAALFRKARGHLLRLKREGRLDGRRADATLHLAALDEEIVDCQDAPVALGDLAGIRALPTRLACRLLLTRVRVLVHQARLAEALEAARALCALRATEPEDLYALARRVAACAEYLADGRWDGPPSPERQALRGTCLDRAASALVEAADRGLHDPNRLEADETLHGLRQVPAFRQLLARLREPEPAHEGGR